MKNFSRISFILLIIVTAIGAPACNKSKTTAQNSPTNDTLPRIVSDKMRFTESTYPYRDGFIVANFGSSELNPLNLEGKGYLLFLKETTVTMLIPPDGNLNAPRGMYERNGWLFIADVGKIVVYNLNSLNVKPQTVWFPKEDVMVNDLAAHGDTLFATVSNTGRIFTVNIKDPARVSREKPVKYINIPGPNGIAVASGKLYICSFSQQGKPDAANVVYVVNDLKKPVPEKIITQPGNYDGIAVSDGGTKLYVSNWSPAGVIEIDLSTKVVKKINLPVEVTGPADFSLKDGELIIPDLVKSRVITMKAP